MDRAGWIEGGVMAVDKMLIEIICILIARCDLPEEEREYLWAQVGEIKRGMGIREN